MPANPEVEAYIRQKARELGIDENTAVAVSRAEALNVFDPNKPDLGGDEGSSFGPFQLHYKGYSKSMPNPGLGDAFTAATGLHASDPSTWRQQVDFALATAAKDGWRQWMGAANTGIGRWAGIGGNAGAKAQAASASPYTLAKPGGKTAETQGPISIRHPPNPQTGTEGYGFPAGGPGTGIETPYTIADKKEDRRQETLKDMLGIGMAGGPASYGNWQMPQLPEQVGAARVDQPAVPTVDPQQTQMQRQQLAMILARLNQGGLV